MPIRCDSALQARSSIAALLPRAFQTRDAVVRFSRRRLLATRTLRCFPTGAMTPWREAALVRLLLLLLLLMPGPKGSPPLTARRGSRGQARGQEDPRGGLQRALLGVPRRARQAFQPRGRSGCPVLGTHDGHMRQGGNAATCAFDRCVFRLFASRLVLLLLFARGVCEAPELASRAAGASSPARAPRGAFSENDLEERATDHLSARRTSTAPQDTDTTRPRALAASIHAMPAHARGPALPAGAGRRVFGAGVCLGRACGVCSAGRHRQRAPRGTPRAGPAGPPLSDKIRGETTTRDSRRAVQCSGVQRQQRQCSASAGPGLRGLRQGPRPASCMSDFSLNSTA